MKVEAVKGKQVSLEWTETSGGLWDWGQEKKGMTEDEMVGWHHRLDAHGFG